MLNENIKAIRTSKGLSQQELAVKLNVVRQTISKWEQGLSVPDSDLLISLSEALETPVSTLLGETVMESDVDPLKAISAKLEVINLQLAQRKTTRRRILHWLLLSLCAVIAAIFAFLSALNSPYLGWDYSDPETAVIGVALHGLEWLFVRADHHPDRRDRRDLLDTEKGIAPHWVRLTPLREDKGGSWESGPPVKRVACTDPIRV